MEDLENKITALTSENSALKGEVAHLQHIIKQMTHKSEGNQSAIATCNKSVAVKPSPTSRNAQAGIYLLIVLFSLGLLVNVAGHGHGNALRIGGDALRVHEPIPRASRRDTSPVMNLLDRSEKRGDSHHMVDEWEVTDDMDPEEFVSDHSLKRTAPEEDDDEDEDQLPTSYKRARIRAADVDSEGEDDHEELTDDNPVAIALLVPPHPRHHPPEVSRMMSSFLNSNHRTLNVHVWPLSR